MSPRVLPFALSFQPFLGCDYPHRDLNFCFFGEKWMLRQEYPLAEAWSWHQLCVYATGGVATTPFPSQLGRWCHGLNFLPFLHIISSPRFRAVITLSTKEESAPHPKTSRKKGHAHFQPGLNCSFGFSLAFPATSVQAMPEESPDTLSPS